MYPCDLDRESASRTSFTFGAFVCIVSFSFTRIELFPIACNLSRSIRDDASRRLKMSFCFVMSAAVAVSVIRGYNVRIYAARLLENVESSADG